MPVAAAIGAVVGIAGIVTSLSGAKKAERAAKAAAKEEARLEGIVTREKLRQMGIDQLRTEGETILGGAASGVEVGDGRGDNAVMETSVTSILDEVRKNYGNERSAVARAGATRAANALTRGSNAASIARYQGISNALNYTGMIANAFATYQSNRSG